MDALSALVAFVGVSDFDAATRFYGEVLGLALSDERPFALVAEVGGTALRITKVAQVDPAPHTVLGWEVLDIESTIRDLMGRGVTFMRYEGLEQDSDAIWRAPNGARIAWFLDPDGNNLSLTELPASTDQ